MSETPETDAVQHEGLLRTNPIPMQVVTANFARKLERERDEARTELEMWRDGNIMSQIHRDELEKVERERDEAREIAHDLAVIASHCLGSHSFSLSETSERIADTLKRWRSTQTCKK
jgi:hypothetical protein